MFCRAYCKLQHINIFQFNLLQKELFIYIFLNISNTWISEIPVFFSAFYNKKALERSIKQKFLEATQSDVLFHTIIFFVFILKTH